VQLHKWYHVTLTRQGPSIKLYVNGVLEASASNSAVDQILDFDLGRHYGDSRYNINGKLAELRLYGRALAPFEIANLYNSNIQTLSKKVIFN